MYPDSDGLLIADTSVKEGEQLPAPLAPQEGRELQDEKALEQKLEAASLVFMGEATGEIEKFFNDRMLPLTDNIRASIDASVNRLASIFVALAGGLARASDVTRKRVEKTSHASKRYVRPPPNEFRTEREGDQPERSETTDARNDGDE